MNILFLVVFLMVALGGGWYYFKNKEKIKGWFSKEKKDDKNEENLYGDVYLANINDDCTGIPDDQKKYGASIEIQVHSSDKASIHGIIKGTGTIQDIISSSSSSPSDIQTGIFVNSGCIKYTTEGDVIKYNVKDSDINKWFGNQSTSEELNNSIVFKRESKDVIIGTDIYNGSVCRFKKQTNKKAPKECSKPGFGCSMM